MEAVTIASDLMAYGHVNTNYWLYGHQTIAEVEGVGNLRGVRAMQRISDKLRVAHRDRPLGA